MGKKTVFKSVKPESYPLLPPLFIGIDYMQTILSQATTTVHPGCAGGQAGREIRSHFTS